MASYPTGVFSPRTIENRPGVVYDANDTKTLYAEDLEAITDEIVAIENELGASPKGAFASVSAYLADLTSQLSDLSDYCDTLFLMVRFIIDLMEYATDGAAQAAYVTNATAGLELYNVALFADANLQGYWRLSDVNDAGPNGYNLTNTGSVAFSAGKFGNAPTFDGTAKYLSISGASSLNLAKTGDQSICFWYNPSAIADAWRVLLGKTNSSYTSGFMIQQDVGSHLAVNFYGITGGSQVTSTVVLSNSTWYFVCAIWDKTAGKIRIFVNDTKTELTGRSGNVADNSGNAFAIGKGGDVASYAKGMIDDVAFFDKALSDAEVATIYTKALQSYKEATIKTEGSYALKGFANKTDSLNKTLTKTLSPVKNLTGKGFIKFDIRAARTGSNIKIGFHDSGGTTTEVTPNIAQADTFQTVTLDISAVSDANKDAIDSIIITIVNADANNTFYIDNMYS